MISCLPLMETFIRQGSKTLPYGVVCLNHKAQKIPYFFFTSQRFPEAFSLFLMFRIFIFFICCKLEAFFWVSQGLWQAILIGCLSRYSRTRVLSHRHLKPDISQVEVMRVGVISCLNSMSKSKTSSFRR